MGKSTTSLDIVPQRVNANKHTQRGMGELERSIEQDGWIGAITVAADGETFDGSARLKKLATAGLREPLIIDQDGTQPIVIRRTDIPTADDPRAKRLAIAANKIAADNLDWDAEVLAALSEEIDLSTLFRDEELAALLAAPVDIGGAGDEFDTTPEEGPTRAQAGDLWIIGEKHRLLVGDCTDAANAARLMGGERADCVFTSPPYAVGVDYGEEYEDTIENLREMLPKLSALWLDVVTPGGFAVVNFGDIAPARNVAGSDEPCEYPMAMEYWPVFRADGWLLWSRRIWCKPNPRVHSPWCIQSNRAATDWEHLWTWRKPGEPIIRRVDGEMRSALGWYQSSLMHGVDVGKEIHGAGMALGIVEWMLNIHSRRGRVVFEPFGGTGTTLIGGHLLGRKVYACELVPRSADVILRRAEAAGLTTRRDG